MPVTSTVAEYGPLSCFRPSKQYSVTSSLHWGLQLPDKFLGENVLEEQKDEADETDKPLSVRAGLASLQ